VEAGVAAGIFTIAVNTGPLDASVLLNSGAHLLFPSMESLCDVGRSVQRFTSHTVIKQEVFT
jgi:uncharacterized membrane protein YhfC